MGGGQSSTMLVNAMNDMVANIIVNVAMTCNSTADSTQIISIDCRPPVSQGRVFENNPACLECINNIVSAKKAKYDLQKSAWKSGRQPPEVRIPIDQDFQETIENFISCTATSKCKACVVQDISQQTMIQSTTNCQAFNNVKNEIDQKLMANITQELNNHQDVLSSLAQMLGARSTKEVSANITNRISATLTQNVISNIQHQIDTFQPLYFNFGTSTQVSGITQQTAVTSVQTYLQKTQLLNGIFESDEIKQFDTLMNDQATIDTIGNAIGKGVDYISKLLKSIVGKVMIGILSLVGIVFLIVIGYVSGKAIENKIKQDQEEQQQFLQQQGGNVRF